MMHISWFHPVVYQGWIRLNWVGLSWIRLDRVKDHFHWSVHSKALTSAVCESSDCSSAAFQALWHGCADCWLPAFLGWLGLDGIWLDRVGSVGIGWKARPYGSLSQQSIKGALCESSDYSNAVRRVLWHALALCLADKRCHLVLFGGVCRGVRFVSCSLHSVAVLLQYVVSTSFARRFQ